MQATKWCTVGIRQLRQWLTLLLPQSIQGTITARITQTAMLQLLLNLEDHPFLASLDYSKAFDTTPAEMGISAMRRAGFPEGDLVALSAACSDGSRRRAGATVHLARTPARCRRATRRARWGWHASS